MDCFCGSGHIFTSCCEPFISLKKLPKTAEQLIRSRYCAYVEKNIVYIQLTMTGNALKQFDHVSTLTFMNQTNWTSLTILNTEKGLKNHTTGIVEFQAMYLYQNQLQTLHEESEFIKINHKWLYCDGIQ